LSYWVAVVARNAAAHLPRTLDSLLHQSQKPKRITVVDDGSTDETSTILRDYEKRTHLLRVLTNPDKGYDIRRVPRNINAAWERNASEGLETQYFMISGDDCIYPPEYSCSLSDRMDSNVSLVVASGKPSAGGTREHSPSGSGRMVRCSFWQEISGHYPSKAGWETWLLYKAAQKGLEVRLFQDLSYEHARPRGAGHQFMYWGAAMGTLGYHPLYALGRVAINAVKPSLAPVRAVNMLRGYLQAQLGSSDTFIVSYDHSLQSFVRRRQSQRITKIISSRLRISNEIHSSETRRIF
jgi:hypothetical protein